MAELDLKIIICTDDKPSGRRAGAAARVWLIGASFLCLWGRGGIWTEQLDEDKTHLRVFFIRSTLVDLL